MRERLIELLKHEFGTKVSEITADWLIENGVVAPPCKIGQTVWLCTSPENISGYDFDGDGEQKEVFECVVENVTFYSKGTNQVRCYCNGKFVAHYLRFSDFGKTVFLTREEAEQALRTPQNDEVRE